MFIEMIDWQPIVPSQSNQYQVMKKLLVSINQSLNTCQILCLEIFQQS